MGAAAEREGKGACREEDMERGERAHRRRAQRERERERERESVRTERMWRAEREGARR